MVYIEGDEPTVTILLLGDDQVGKSTFLSYVHQYSHLVSSPNMFIRRLAEGTTGSILRTTPSAASTLPTLRDLDQPFLFNIKMYNRPYQFEFYDTASPTHFTLLRPDFLILCYDITRRSTLTSLTTTWKSTIEGHFNYDESIPIMLLGLKRDLREEWTQEEQDEGRLGESIMPQEGLRVAQEMRLDRYAECSAVTGELCREVLEDIARVAGRTTTEKGGRTDGTTCVVM
jgi:Ras family protein A